MTSTKENTTKGGRKTGYEGEKKVQVTSRYTCCGMHLMASYAYLYVYSLIGTYTYSYSSDVHFGVHFVIIVLMRAWLHTNTIVYPYGYR